MVLFTIQVIHQLGIQLVIKNSTLKYCYYHLLYCIIRNLFKPEVIILKPHILLYIKWIRAIGSAKYLIITVIKWILFNPFFSPLWILINLTFRLCGPGSASKFTNLCNPALGNEWIDGHNTDIKYVLGTGGLWAKKTSSKIYLNLILKNQNKPFFFKACFSAKKNVTTCSY